MKAILTLTLSLGMVGITLSGCSSPKENAVIQDKVTSIVSKNKETQTSNILPTVKLTEQEKALILFESKKKFQSETNISAEEIEEPFFFDINNDGIEEVIVTNISEGISHNETIALSIYDLNLNLLSNLADEADHSPFTLHKVKNKTYENCLANVNYGVSGHSATIYTLKEKQLKEIGYYDTSGEFEMDDIDGDGFHEFKGWENDSGIGSERVSRAAGFMDAVVYKWNEQLMKYQAEYEDAPVLKEVEPLNKTMAAQILEAAKNVQVSWFDPVDSPRDLLRPFFTNNFISEFESNEYAIYDEESGGYLPVYIMVDDGRGLLPYNPEDPIEIESIDESTYRVTQKTVTSVEGYDYEIQIEIILLKTVKGWKVDKFQYL